MPGLFEQFQTEAQDKTPHVIVLMLLQVISQILSAQKPDMDEVIRLRRMLLLEDEGE